VPWEAVKLPGNAKSADFDVIFSSLVFSFTISDDTIKLAATEQNITTENTEVWDG
jgi:hypothetical protein